MGTQRHLTCLPRGRGASLASLVRRSRLRPHAARLRSWTPRRATDHAGGGRLRAIWPALKAALASRGFSGSGGGGCVCLPDGGRRRAAAGGGGDGKRHRGVQQVPPGERHGAGEGNARLRDVQPGRQGGAHRGERDRPRSDLHLRPRVLAEQHAERGVRVRVQAHRRRHAQRILRDDLRVRPDGEREDLHHGGRQARRRGGARRHPARGRAPLRPDQRRGGRADGVHRRGAVRRDLHGAHPRPPRQDEDEGQPRHSRRPRARRVRRPGDRGRRQKRPRRAQAARTREQHAPHERHGDERAEQPKPRNLHHHRAPEAAVRPHREDGPPQPRRPRRFGAGVQDGREGPATRGSEDHQQVAQRARQRHQGADGREEQLRSVPRQQADAHPPGQPRRVEPRGAHRGLLAELVQPVGDDLHAALRNARKVHQEQAARARRLRRERDGRGSDEARGGDRAPEGRDGAHAQ